MWRVSLVVNHRPLEVTPGGLGLLQGRLARHFGVDQSAEGLQKSRVCAGKRGEAVGPKVCFGYVHSDFSFVALRNTSHQLEITLEVESHADYARAATTVHHGVKNALSALKLKPRVDTLEVMYLRDTTPVLTGKVGLVAHLSRWEVAGPVLAAVITAVILGFGGAFIWNDDRSFWLNAIPVLIPGIVALLVVVAYVARDSIRWYPGRGS